MTPFAQPPAEAVRVAFQGELGAFSEEAVQTFFGGAAVPVPCREFREVGEAVQRGEAEFGLLPVENSLAGSVLAAFDVLAGRKLRIVGETIRPIRHCLLGVRGATLDEVRRVISHPVALAQCTRFLIAHSAIEAVAVYDTAGAAREVAAGGNRAVAAIASRGAAERYDLDVLADDLQDRSDNQTRFVVVSPTDAPPPPSVSHEGGFRTALLIEADNTPGALVRVLAPFAERGINLSKLESRPGEVPWTYRFFLEFDADAAEPRSAAALAELRGVASVHVLGSFPRGRFRCA